MIERVIFVRNYRMYQKGESAGFPHDEAHGLVSKGVARWPGEASTPRVETPDSVAFGDIAGVPGDGSEVVAVEKAAAAPTEKKGAGAPPKQGRGR